MSKIWEESNTGLKVNKEYLEKKAQNGEFLGNRDEPLPKITEAYRKGWDRTFGKHNKVPNLRNE